MTTLERHCQLLLRVYPAEYRDVRGEEIIGTLLEATPPGRSWPRRRDIWGLIFGGLRARAARNRERTTAANLRQAAFAGVAAYLVYVTAAFLSSNVSAGVSTWPVLLASVLTFVAVVLALVTGSRIVVLAAVLPAAAAVCYAGPWTTRALEYAAAVLPILAVHLALLAALVALAGTGKRLSRGLLVLVGLFAVLPVVGRLAVPFLGAAFGLLLLSAVAASIVWAVIDARPAMALVVLFLALFLPLAIGDLLQGFGVVSAVPELVITSVVAGGALWLLRHQSAHPGRPSRIP
jgi:hypothetical protein